MCSVYDWEYTSKLEAGILQVAKLKTLLSQTDPPPPYPLMLKISLCVKEELGRVSGKSDLIFSPTIRMQN